MKKLFLILITMLLTAATFAQSVPQTANFSATVRDGSNRLLANTSLTMRISFYQGESLIYWEEHIAETNENGFVAFLMNREMADQGGSVASFDDIPWEDGGYTMNVQYKRTGGDSYTDFGNFELTSGFYAFAAQKLEGFDIDVSGASSGNVLVYNASTGKWEASAESQTIADAAALGNSVNTQLKNVTDPTDNQDATTKKYVDDLIATLEAAVEALQNRRPVVVTFDANGGSGSMQFQVFLTGAAQAISANTFTKTDYGFLAWNTAADGSGTLYTDGQSITISENITLYAQWVAATGTQGEHGWVDLGLPSGTRWATCNVGASTPTDYGNYFAWGETTTKSSYAEDNYTYSDNPTTLPSSADAATANWGSGWRMPTDTEMQELVDNCDTTWTTQNGVAGMLFTSRTNGSSIFLPAAGGRFASGLNSAGSWGNYWSSSLYTDITDYAWRLIFSSGYYNLQYNGRCYGQSVRAVCQSQNIRPVVVTFDANGGSGSMQSQVFLTGAAQTISVNTFTKTNYFFTGWNTAADGSGEAYADSQEITITENVNVTLYAQWSLGVTASVNGHDYVDLGLPSGTKWATCNIGATNPEDYGDYFAWGETTPKETYSWSTYRYCNGRRNTLTKYCNNSSYGNNGFTDALTTLEATDDAATANWGSAWRMPTIEEFEELNSNCTVTWTTQNGVNGGLFTGPNGNSIFLPVSYGYYWSSSLYTGSTYRAWYLYFDSGDCSMNYSNRYNGQSVRAVCQSQN